MHLREKFLDHLKRPRITENRRHVPVYFQELESRRNRSELVSCVLCTEHIVFLPRSKYNLFSGWKGSWASKSHLPVLTWEFQHPTHPSLVWHFHTDGNNASCWLASLLSSIPGRFLAWLSGAIVQSHGQRNLCFDHSLGNSWVEQQWWQQPMIRICIFREQCLWKIVIWWWPWQLNGVQIRPAQRQLCHPATRIFPPLPWTMDCWCLGWLSMRRNKYKLSSWWQILPELCWLTTCALTIWHQWDQVQGPWWRGQKPCGSNRTSNRTKILVPVDPFPDQMCHICKEKHSHSPCWPVPTQNNCSGMNEFRFSSLFAKLGFSLLE